MNAKIVFSDIDGTLLNKERALSPETIESVKKLKGKVPFVLISARMPQAMTHLQAELALHDEPLICYNGGYVLANGQVISSTFIPVTTIEKIAAFNQQQNIHLSLYHADEWHVPAYDYWAKREANNTKVEPQVTPTQQVIENWKKKGIGAHKIMCMGEENDIEAMFQFLTAQHGDELHIYRSKPTYIEIANKKISKLTAIEELLNKHYPYSLSETIAFGDNYNDVEMIGGVGLGIAVDNARDEVKAVAQQITAPSIEHGVAKSLANLFNA